MTTDQLTTLIRAAPFRPFVIHMAGGRKIPVPNPELIAHEPTSPAKPDTDRAPRGGAPT